MIQSDAIVATRAGARWPFSAMALSLVCLALISLFALCVPMASPHAFDRVYSEYVRVMPSSNPHPTPDEAKAAAERIARRMRVELVAIAHGQGEVQLTLRGARAIDQRLLALFERGDVFAAPNSVITKNDGREMDVIVALKSNYFLFGTDGNGRDLLVRTAIAGRLSLAIGLLAAAVALIIGVAYGATAGFLGGRIDSVMMRAVDVLYAMPYMFFIILLIAFFGRSVWLIFVAVGAVEWLDMARIVRGETLSLKQREFVQAAQALGVSKPKIIARHIVPNMLGSIIAYATLLVPKVILLESFLSFLGLGVQEPNTSWGVLIADGARAIDSAPYLLICPAALLSLTLLSLSLLGESLRQYFEPHRQRGRS